MALSSSQIQRSKGKQFQDRPTQSPILYTLGDDGSCCLLFLVWQPDSDLHLVSLKNHSDTQHILKSPTSLRIPTPTDSILCPPIFLDLNETERSSSSPSSLGQLDLDVPFHNSLRRCSTCEKVGVMHFRNLEFTIM